MTRSKVWQHVMTAQRNYNKGDGWWTIELSCSHRADVLHGTRNPLGEECKCTYRCGEESRSEPETDSAALPDAGGRVSQIETKD